MVAARQKIIPVLGAEPKNIECQTIDEALHKDIHGSIMNAVGIGILRFHTDIARDTTNIRVGEETVTIIETGCTNDPISYQAEQPVVVPCPEDVAKRCGGCILNVAGGEQIHEWIEKYREPKMQTYTDCF